MQQPSWWGRDNSQCVSSTSSCRHDYANIVGSIGRPGEQSASRAAERRARGSQYLSPSAPERAKTRDRAGAWMQDRPGAKLIRPVRLRQLIHLFERLQTEQEDRIQDQQVAQVKSTNKQATIMRNIITPVDYQASESELSDDSLDDQQPGNQPGKQRKLYESNLHRKLTNTNWAPPTDWRQYEHLTTASSPICPNGPQPRPTLSFAHRAATCGPAIVKHQRSSSKRLLNQLARLRKLDEPHYRVKRPEKVAQVESLIEQLEKVADDLRDDERLLDRADSRDWPAEFHRRLIEEATETSNEQPCIQARSCNHTHPQEVRATYRMCDPMEEQAINRSHQRLTPSEAGSTLPTRLHRTRPSPFADRYLDDLAVRRLSQLSRGSTGSVGSQWQHQMSYLLCTSAYTPDSRDLLASTVSIDDQLELDKRLYIDDLHYRNHAKTKLDPFEPLFGIPRQVTSHSSASHYLRQQACRDQSSELGPQVQRRPDSRVSFSLKQTSSPAGGRISADSGLPPGFGSPMSPAPSTSIHPKPIKQAKNIDNQPQAVTDLDDDDAAVEVDLPVELESKSGERESSSPILECYQAEFRATPTRRRPRIEVKNPRAKSPLLRTTPTSPSPLPTACKMDPAESPVQVQCYTDTWQRRTRRSKQEFEVQFDFSSDEDNQVQNSSEESEKATRILTTLDNSSPGSSLNESSIERLHYRGEKSTSGQSPQMKLDSPRFSIGEYKSLDRRSGLKIL